MVELVVNALWAASVVNTMLYCKLKWTENYSSNRPSFHLSTANTSVCAVAATHGCVHVRTKINIEMLIKSAYFPEKSIHKSHCCISHTGQHTCSAVCRPNNVPTTCSTRAQRAVPTISAVA